VLSGRVFLAKHNIEMLLVDIELLNKPFSLQGRVEDQR
jgi:hypothetical protein